jgi:hypothetical protein
MKRGTGKREKERGNRERKEKQEKGERKLIKERETGKEE